MGWLIENVTAVKVLTAALNGFEDKSRFLLSRALGSGPLNLAIDAPQESQENRHMWPSQHKERVVKASRSPLPKSVQQPSCLPSSSSKIRLRADERHEDGDKDAKQHGGRDIEGV